MNAKTPSEFLDKLWAAYRSLADKYEYPGLGLKLASLKEEGNLTQQAWHLKQEVRLRHLLTYAKKHVPYYRDIMQQIGFDPECVDIGIEMQKLPLLNKECIRNNRPFLIAEGVRRPGVYKDATGGSTGNPIEFYHDQEYRTTAQAIDAYVRAWWGIRPFDRTALLWGADREFEELSWKDQFYQKRSRTRILNAFRMNQESLIEFCRMLEQWQPPYLMGYSSALEEMARCANSNGLTHLRFKVIRSTAETLWPHQRELVQRTFNTPVSNFYGSREINNIAAECPEYSRLHLISTWRYVEIVDELGNRVPDGQLGYITITDLSNFTMPFIRYRNDDIGKFAKTQCSCGRPNPVLEELLGRSSDLIRTPHGEVIHGEFFTHLFYGLNEIRSFQVHQTALDHLVLRYVPIGKLPQGVLDDIITRINKRLGYDVMISVERCEAIPCTPSGKYRFTMSDVNAYGL